jgi:hypothetical protein
MTRDNDARFTHGYRSVAEYLMADMAASRAKRGTAADLRKVQAAIAAGRWRADVQAKAWVGYAVAAALGLDPVADRAKITGLLKMWIASGALVIVEGVDDRRERRPFVKVGAPANG